MRSKGEKRVKIVVESLKDVTSHWCEWIESPHDAILMLSEIQATLRQLDAAMLAMDESNRPARRTTGSHCYGCKIKEACREGSKWLARDKLTPKTWQQNSRPPGRDMLVTA
jgi:hypothetical protein